MVAALLDDGWYRYGNKQHKCHDRFVCRPEPVGPHLPQNALDNDGAAWNVRIDQRWEDPTSTESGVWDNNFNGVIETGWNELDRHERIPNGY